MKNPTYYLTFLFIAFLSNINAQTYFIEDSSVVIVEVESAPDLKQWDLLSTVVNNDTIFYLLWDGNQYLNNPGQQLLEYKIRINNPGTYRFIWHSKVGNGTSATDHNDDWLRIPDAADFYGKRFDGHIVRPKGVCTDDCPDGAGSNGWFKVYSSGTTNWTWSTRTSDNDAHNIYAQFDTAGMYTVQISARSSYHLLNRFVLYKDSEYNESEVNKLDLPESRLFPFNKPASLLLIGDSLYTYYLENVDTSVIEIYVTIDDSSMIDSVHIEEILDGRAKFLIQGIPDVKGNNGLTYHAVTKTEDTISINQKFSQIKYINRAPIVEIIADTTFDITEAGRIVLRNIHDGNDGNQKINIYTSVNTAGVIGTRSLNYTQGSDSAVITFNLLSVGRTRMTIRVRDDGGTDIGGADETSFDFLIRVEETTSLNRININKKIKIAPNPVSDIFRISGLDLNPQTFIIFNSSGQKVMEASNSDNQNLLNVSILPEGMYMLVGTKDHSTILSQKFIKR